MKKLSLEEYLLYLSDHKNDQASTYDIFHANDDYMNHLEAENEKLRQNVKETYEAYGRIEQQKIELKLQNKTLADHAREAVNTTWRFIGAYKKENNVPISGALKSAEYHLGKIDYIFEEDNE